MFGKAWLMWWSAVAAVASLSTAGCQLQPRAVIKDLPVDFIVEASPPPPAPQRPRPKPKQQRPKASPRRSSAPPGWAPPKNFSRPWRWIVIHHSATDFGSAKIFDRAHRARGWDELGYHFVINNGRGGTDGNVEVGSRWTKQKWGAHCKTPDNAYNNYGIGICIVGDLSHRLPSRAQLKSLRELVIFLSDRYGIRPANVIGHRDAPQTATKCPGEALHRYIHGVLRPVLAGRRSVANR